MAQVDSSKLHKIIEIALQHGYQLSPNALAYLANTTEYELLLKKAKIDTDHGIITEEALKLITEPKPGTISNSTSKPAKADSLISKEITPSNSTSSLVNSSALKIETTDILAKDYSTEIEILTSYTTVKGSGGIDGFYHVIKNRFEKLRKLIENRPDAHGCIPLSSMTKVPRNEPIKVLGIIRTINRTKKGGLILSLEDESGVGQCLIPLEKIKNYIPLLDTMILVNGKPTDSFIIADEISQPDVPSNFRSSYADVPLFAVLLSDIHIGSKTFIEDGFLKLISFLQGNSSSFPDNINKISPLIKYVLIAGDIVDGIGIYPGQEEDLTIPDIRSQYDSVARIFSTIPEHIEIIIIPGNHDATRLALPQPPIDQAFADTLEALPNVQFLGNPSTLKLHGVKFLMNHGRPLDDTIPAVPGANFQNQKEVLVQLMKARHLGPIYGEKTAMAPETHDFLVIDEVPDVWHLGHTHVNEFVNYHGVKIINSGTFQSQTDWQKSVNIQPSPGIVPFFNLQNHGVVHLSFL